MNRQRNPFVPRKRQDLLEFLRSHLLNDIVPFWERHGPDEKSGAFRTCIADDGTMLSEDLYFWSQLRAIWTFSALYNRIEKRERWLGIAEKLVSFCSEHGRDESGYWCYRVDRHGEVLEGPTSIYTDGFAIYGMTEYHRATGDELAASIALETCEKVQERLRKPGSYRIAPYRIPWGAKAHGISMIFSLVFHEAGKQFGRPDIARAGLEHAQQVMKCFHRKETGLVLEYLRLDGSELPGPEGRVVLPGHAIESMWFMLHLFRDVGERQMIEEAIDCIRRHLEFGWDRQYGGLFLALDSEGKTPAWPHWEKKLWWPHTEALYALILAKEFSRAEWIMDWYEKVHAYAFDRFPDREHGEWTQRLGRNGSKVTEVIALPVKDPFHLPRALILSIESLTRQGTMED